MSHPLLKILEDIQKEYEFDYAYCGSTNGITLLVNEREARKLAAFEARDLAVATAVRDACEKSGSLSWEAHPFCIRAVDLNEIIKGVK